MDLADLMYCIKASDNTPKLTVERLTDGSYQARLYDSIHDLCVVEGDSVRPPEGSNLSYAEACTTGPSSDGALQALVALLAGNSVGYSVPIQCKSFLEWLRVPPTLVAGMPVLTPLADVQNAEEPYTPPAVAEATA